MAGQKNLIKKISYLTPDVPEKMQPDLLGLPLTKGELKRLSGVGVRDIYRPPTNRKFIWELSTTILSIFLLTVSCFLLTMIFPDYRYTFLGTHGAIATLLIFNETRKISLSQKNQNLIKLFEDVERFNSVIQAIDINDKIEAAGNPTVSLKNRARVIEALELTRADLVRALKTERILRENKRFIDRNPELFANNLESLAALQVSDRATEHGRILNEAMQIAVGVREEMRKLKDTRQYKSIKTDD